MNYPNGLVFGLLSSAKRNGDERLCEHLRSLTISWSRYGYYGRIIESDNLDEILSKSADAGYRWCFVQASGHMIGENWYPRHWNRVPLEVAIKNWIEQRDFLVGATIIGDEDQGYGLDDQCLLVDLQRYIALGRPKFGEPSTAEIECIRPEVFHMAEGSGSMLRYLGPSDHLQRRVPTNRGWKLIDASLRNGLQVHELGEAIEQNLMCLDLVSGDQTDCIRQYIGFGIAAFKGDDAILAPERQRLLRSVDTQVKNARRGVFLWNLESYEDVSVAPRDFERPVSSLYTVAAGLKPNMILRNLGMDEKTRVVFFDYSDEALEVRRMIDTEWNGEDYPDFIRQVFRKHPHPETFYQLWAGLTPDKIAWEDVDRLWQTELERWGGAAAIRDHWQRYRRLEHEYIACNLLADRQPLLDRIRREKNAVIWWSNAFFTVFSNWLYTIDQRREIYLGWVREVAGRNPDLFLYGSDFNNISVNHVRAGAYLSRLTSEGYDYLNPLKVNQCEIRF
jgi:hypothetical protein